MSSPTHTTTPVRNHSQPAAQNSSPSNPGTYLGQGNGWHRQGERVLNVWFGGALLERDIELPQLAWVYCTAHTAQMPNHSSRLPLLPPSYIAQN